VTYEEQQASLADRYGWTYEEIDNMTFTQIHNAICEGKTERRFPIRSHDDLIRLNRRMRRILLGH
jgi:hypothetical protein